MVNFTLQIINFNRVNSGLNSPFITICDGAKYLGGPNAAG